MKKCKKNDSDYEDTKGLNVEIILVTVDRRSPKVERNEWSRRGVRGCEGSKVLDLLAVILEVEGPDNDHEVMISESMKKGEC